MIVLRTAVILPLLISILNAQLMAPREPVCPGNRIIFSCNQTNSLVRWIVDFPSGTVPQTSDARSTQVGSVFPFRDNDPFHFEIHVLSYNSNTLTTELQVTAVNQLNGITVTCEGPDPSSDFTSPSVQIASVAVPSGITKTYNHFTKFGASINVTWSTDGAADYYTIGVTPPVMPGQMSHFTTTKTSLQLMLSYNVNYSINITAHYHNCNNWTVVSVIVDGCSPPKNGIISDYTNGSVGAMLRFQCNTSAGYIPQEQSMSTCMENGSWIPIPQCMLADCGLSMTRVANGVVTEPFNDTQFGATIRFHCEEGLVPVDVLEAVCGRTGVWHPNPANHRCVNQSLVSCSAPLVPSSAHTADQSNTIYLEGTKVTFQCDNGSQALLTTCHVNGDWIPPPDELDCNPRSVNRITLSTRTQVILAAIAFFLMIIVILFIGALCFRRVRVTLYKWSGDLKLKPPSRATQDPSMNTQAAPSSPHIGHPSGTTDDPPMDTQAAIYEEIDLPSADSPSKETFKDNDAYGIIMCNLPSARTPTNTQASVTSPTIAGKQIHLPSAGEQNTEVSDNDDYAN